jgi:hypothetical protein
MARRSGHRRGRQVPACSARMTISAYSALRIRSASRALSNTLDQESRSPRQSAGSGDVTTHRRGPSLSRFLIRSCERKASAQEATAIPGPDATGRSGVERVNAPTSAALAPSRVFRATTPDVRWQSQTARRRGASTVTDDFRAPGGALVPDRRPSLVRPDRRRGNSFRNCLVRARDARHWREVDGGVRCRMPDLSRGGPVSVSVAGPNSRPTRCQDVTPCFTAPREWRGSSAVSPSHYAGLAPGRPGPSSSPPQAAEVSVARSCLAADAPQLAPQRRSLDSRVAHEEPPRPHRQIVREDNQQLLAASHALSKRARSCRAGTSTGCQPIRGRGC